MQILSLIKQKPLFKFCFAFLFSAFVGLVLLALFSLLLFLTGGNQMAYKIVSLLIRLLTVGFCALFLTGEKGGILNGLTAGVIGALGVQLTFSLISWRFDFGKFALNTLFCVIFGVIFGIIFVNLKNNGKSS